jgi:hypothetical protein
MKEVSKNIKDYYILISPVKKENEKIYFDSLDNMNDFLKKYDKLNLDIYIFYKNIIVGKIEVSYSDFMGIKNPNCKIVIRDDSFDVFFDESFSAPMGDEWDWKIYKFKELENEYLIIDGEYINSYHIQYNEKFTSMNKQEISDWLIDKYF